jgi:hypothetical protein
MRRHNLNHLQSAVLSATKRGTGASESADPLFLKTEEFGFGDWTSME